MLGTISKLVLFILLIVVCISYLSQNNSFEVYMYDIGQGDSLRVKMPNGVNLLIDGGPDYTIDRYLSNDFFLACSIDVLLLTHPHADHIAGLVRYLNRCTPIVLISNFTIYDSVLFSEWEELIKKGKVISVAKGDTFYFGNVRMDILWPPLATANEIDSTINNSSIVTYLSYGGLDALLLGDSELPVLKQLKLPSDLDILKIPHHGSVTGMYIPI